MGMAAVIKRVMESRNAIGSRISPPIELRHDLIMKLMKFAIPAGWICVSALAASADALAAVNQPDSKARQTVSNSSSASSFDTLLKQAEDLLANDKPGDAYRLLEPFEFDHAGEVRFDYLLGVAALNGGQPDKATFALERVLAVNPDHASARLEIARAYYQLGDLPRARTEFLAVLRQNPSEMQRTDIQKYLNEIASREGVNRTRYSGYLGTGIGHDSNVNYATNQSQIEVYDSSVPGWVPATLNPDNVRMASNYIELAAGGEIDHSLNERWGAFAGANLLKRANHAHAEFNSFNEEILAGVRYGSMNSRIRVGVMDGRYDLGGSHNRDTSGYKVEWKYEFSQTNQMNALIQSVRYRYIDPLMKPNDIDQQAIGIGWSHTLNDGQSVVYGSIHTGNEKDVSPIIVVYYPSFGNVTVNPSGGRNDGARNFSGLRVGGQLAVGDRTTLFAAAGIQASKFDKVNYLFQRQRQDHLYDLKAGMNWHFEKLWTVQPQLTYMKNDSNIEIYHYTRMDVSLNVRRDFR